MSSSLAKLLAAQKAKAEAAKISTSEHASVVAIAKSPDEVSPQLVATGAGSTPEVDNTEKKPAPLFSFGSNTKVDTASKAHSPGEAQSSAGQAAPIIPKPINPPALPAPMTKHVSVPLTSIARKDPDKLEIDPSTFVNKEQIKNFTDEQVAEFKRSIADLVEHVGDKEVIGQLFYKVLNDMRANPNLVGLLAPADLGLMVRALRQSYGVQVTKKSEKRSNRSAKSMMQGEVSDMLGDLLKMKI